MYKEGLRFLYVLIRVDNLLTSQKKLHLFSLGIASPNYQTQ